MTCFHEVTWHVDAVKQCWVAFDYGTETEHRCRK